MTLPKIAYLTGEYPRASDTFIQREVANLRALGHEVLTCSIRTTGAEHLVGPEQREEHARTFKVLDAVRNPATTLKAHWRWMKTPGRYLSALGLAWRTAPKGIKGRLYNLIYFVEAGVLAAKLADEGVTHLHNHIAKASCTVAMLAGELSGLRWSFTIHGPDIFFEPNHWRIDEKAARAAFVSCISHFCRSQLMCFADAQHWHKLHIVHCGVDPSRYAPKPVRTGLRALFVGRLAGVKGVPILIDAVARLTAKYPDLTLHLVGDGPDRKALETEVARRGLQDRIVFLGYKSQAEVAEELAQTDVFVLPSFAEGVPVVFDGGDGIAGARSDHARRRGSRVGRRWRERPPRAAGRCRRLCQGAGGFAVGCGPASGLWRGWTGQGGRGIRRSTGSAVAVRTDRVLLDRSRGA